VVVRANLALDFKHGVDGRRRLYKYYWMTSGQIDPPAYGAIREELQKSKAVGRVDVWSGEALLARLHDVGLIVGTESMENPMQVFISYANEDAGRVEVLCNRLKADGFAPWRDKEMILPGQEWKLEIRRAMKASGARGAILLCLSDVSVRKRGFVQKEIQSALELREEEPEGSISVIPVLLDNVEVPESLSELHHAKLFDDEDNAGKTEYARLVSALRLRAGQLRDRRG
jgi:hypothetical protein